MDSVAWVCAAEELLEGGRLCPKQRKQESCKPCELSWFATSQQFSQNQTTVVSGDYQPDFLAVVFEASQPGAACSGGFADVGETSFHTL